jgi:V/A-type H+/Na+-transporting ATPase subunit D
MAQNVKPTRMELLNTKKKLRLAQKGHKLLKEKRDALMMEFFSTLKEIKRLRAIVASQITDAQKSLFFVQGFMGVHAIDRLVNGLSEQATVAFSVKSIMGVKVPRVQMASPSTEWFDAVESSPELDNAVCKYREIFSALISLAEKQLTLSRLATEIQKTKRKVNSLDSLIIPNLHKTKKHIAFKLEEHAREDFTRLKKIKEKLEKRALEESLKT